MSTTPAAVCALAHTGRPVAAAQVLAEPGAMAMLWPASLFSPPSPSAQPIYGMVTFSGRIVAFRRRISVLNSPNCFCVSASINAGPINGGTHRLGVWRPLLIMWTRAATLHDLSDKIRSLQITADQSRSDFSVWHKLDLADVVECQRQKASRCFSFLVHAQHVIQTLVYAAVLEIRYEPRHVVVIGKNFPHYRPRRIPQDSRRRPQ
jgi:hypothetical protein